MRFLKKLDILSYILENILFYNCKANLESNKNDYITLSFFCFS